MSKVKVKVIYGLGIGCHQEAVYAYQQAGADAELIHIKNLIDDPKALDDIQVLNISGGFMHGDILGSAMCAANQFAGESGVIDRIWELSEKGGVVYGQCNGFQLLVKSGLLPALDNDYKKPIVTLTHNDCGNYRVSYVPHKLVNQHFAFAGLEEQVFSLWCRHGEGKVQFSSEFSQITKEEAAQHQTKISKHLLLNYVDPASGQATQKFPYNPNGSVAGIAGLQSENGRIFGQMAHPEVSVLDSRGPDWFKQKELKKRGQSTNSEEVGTKIFSNIIKSFA